MIRIVSLCLLTGLITWGCSAPVEVLNRDEQVKKTAIQFAKVINAGKAAELKDLASTPFLVSNDEDGLFDRRLMNLEQIHGWFVDPRGAIKIGERVMAVETLDQHIQVYKALGGGQDHSDFRNMANAMGAEGRVVSMTTENGLGVKGTLLVKYEPGATIRVVGYYP